MKLAYWVLYDWELVENCQNHNFGGWSSSATNIETKKKKKKQQQQANKKHPPKMTCLSALGAYWKE